MSELEAAFREGRLTRRAFVRQLVEGGMPLADALAQAEEVVPSERSTSPPDPVEPPPPRPARGRPTRVEGLEINFVGDGYVVYRPPRDRMHSLNNTAALVLELCTGENDADEMARLLQHAFALPEPPLEEVHRCLDALADEGLIA